MLVRSGHETAETELESSCDVVVEKHTIYVSRIVRKTNEVLIYVTEH